MNPVFILCLFVCLFNQNSNKLHTLYEVGRPAGLEFNNAKTTIGIKWNIQWVFADNELVEKMGYENIGIHNDSVMSIIAQKKGDHWQQSFYSEVDDELNYQNKMREKLRTFKEYKIIPKKLVEPHILFERKRKNKRSVYLVHIVGQKTEDISAGFITLCKFDYSLKKSLGPFNCQEQPLTIFFPQNGIK